MKIQPLHPEHRFRRLILELRKAIWKAKLPAIIINMIFAVYWGSTLFYNVSQIGILRVLTNSLPFLFLLAVLAIIMSYVVKTILKNYTNLLIPIWLDLLFDKYWIFYFLDLNIFDQMTASKNVLENYTSRLNWSSPQAAPHIKYKFADYFVNYQKSRSMTHKVFHLNPTFRNTKLIKWVSESVLVEIIRFLLAYFGTIIPMVFILMPLGMNLRFNFLWALIPMIIVVMIIIFTIILPPSLAKVASNIVIKSILCALFIRDPEHEFTNPKILGIPAYIDYKSIVQQVDSYMIDSKPPSGAEQQ